MGGWTVLGLVVALVVLLNKAFTDLVHVARAKTGRPVLEDVAATTRSKVSGLAAVRRAMGYLPIFRAFVAVEASLLALVAGVVDVARGDLLGTQVLVAVMVPLALVTAGGHLVGVLTSSRLECWPARPSGRPASCSGRRSTARWAACTPATAS